MKKRYPVMKLIGNGEITNTIRIIMMTAVRQPQMRSITTRTLIGPKFDSGDLMKEIILDRRNVPMTIERFKRF